MFMNSKDRVHIEVSSATLEHKYLAIFSFFFFNHIGYQQNFISGRNRA